MGRLYRILTPGLWGLAILMFAVQRQWGEAFLITAWGYSGYQYGDNKCRHEVTEFINQLEEERRRQEHES